jgi:preprotein translocase subunit YajC
MYLKNKIVAGFTSAVLAISITTGAAWVYIRQEQTRNQDSQQSYQQTNKTKTVHTTSNEIGTKTSITKVPPITIVSTKNKKFCTMVSQNSPANLSDSQNYAISDNTDIPTKITATKSVPTSGVGSSAIFIAIAAAAFGIGALILRKKEKQI